MSPYAWLALVTAASATVLALMGALARRIAAARPFALVSLLLVGWSLCYAMQLDAQALSTKLNWLEGRWLFYAWLPLAFLVFTLRHGRIVRWLTRERVALLGVMPAATMLMILTNDLHGLLWTSGRLVEAEGLIYLVVDKGGWAYWIQGYNYTLYLAACAVLVHGSLRGPRPFRRQSQLLLVGALMPMVGNVLRLAEITSPLIDWTPIFLGLSGLLVGVGLFGPVRIFDVAAIDRGAILDAIEDGICVLDARGRLIEANPAALRMLGWPSDKEAPLGRRLDEAFAGVFPANLLEVKELLLFVDQPGLDIDRELEVRGLSVEDPRGDEGRMLVLRDVTEQRQADEALRESDQRLRLLVQQTPLAVIEWNTLGLVTAWNPAAEAIFGYSEAEALGRTSADLIADEEDLESTDVWGALASPAGVTRSVQESRTKSGGVIMCEWYSTPLIDEDGKIIGFASLANDVTERLAADAELKASLAEKVVLLQEVHHRVKNNLQVISSLLAMQSRAVEHRRARLVLEECRNRVISMALIHERLYKTEDLARVDFADYLEDVTEGLVFSYGDPERPVDLEIRTKGVQLGLEVAIPCGLIINELVSNALKHAFVGRERGRLSITLETADAEARTFRLIVSDDGIGLPPEEDLASSKSLGLRIVNTLTRQLGGTMDVGREDGTTFTLTFEDTQAAVSGDLRPAEGQER